MPQIINPFRAPQSPLANVITKVGDQLFGDTLTPAIKREQLQKLGQERLAAERQNVETENLMRAFGGQDADLITASQAAIGAGYKPSDLADLQLFRAANQYGAADPRAQAAQVGAGQTYRNTAGAFGAELAETRRNNNMQSADRRYGVDQRINQDMFEFNNAVEEVMRDGQPVNVRRSEAYGESPILSSTEMSPAMKFNQVYDLLLSQNVPEETARRTALEQSMPRSGGQKITIGPDGTTIESGGIGSLGELTNNVQSTLQKGTLETEQFLSLIDLAKPYVENPEFANDFGVVGKARQIGQGGLEMVGALAQSMGYESADALKAGLQDELAANGAAAFFPNAYDPALDETDALWTLLVYKGAAALAGQEGRSVSDKDVALFTRIFGNPKGLFESQASLRAKLAMAERVIMSQQRVRDNAMAGRPLSTGREQEPAVKVPPADTAGQTAETAIPVDSEATALQMVGKFVTLNGQTFFVSPD